MKIHLTKIILASALVAPMALFLPSLAAADSVSVNFEPSTYTLGSISGQDGWSNAVSPSVDQAVGSNSFGYSSFGLQSLRVSNAYTDGAFGNWIFAKPLTDAVGETSSSAGGFST